MQFDLIVNRLNGYLTREQDMATPKTGRRTKWKKVSICLHDKTNGTSNFHIYSRIACSEDSKNNDPLRYERPDGTVVQVHCVVSGEDESAAHAYIKRQKEAGTALTDLCVIGEVTKCVRERKRKRLLKGKTA